MRNCASLLLLLVWVCTLQADVTQESSLKEGVQLTGILQRELSQEIKVKTLVWKDLVPLNVVSHGQNVKKGQLLIKLDSSRIEEELKVEQIRLKQKKLELALLEGECESLQKSLTLKKQHAEWNLKQAQMHLKNFDETHKPIRESNAKMQFKKAVDALDYEKEELRQLKAMYREDQLVEKTEEMILKRQKNNIAVYQNRVENEKIKLDDVIKLNLPAERVNLLHNLNQKRLSFESLQKEVPLLIHKKQAEVELKTLSVEKLQKRIGQLKEDQKGFEIISPVEGIVYHGRFSKQGWSGNELLEEARRKKVSLPANETVLTVFSKSPFMVKCLIRQSIVHQYPLKGSVTLKKNQASEISYKGSVVHLSEVPTQTGLFELHVRLSEQENLKAGMNVYLNPGVNPIL